MPFNPMVGSAQQLIKFGKIELRYRAQQASALNVLLESNGLKRMSMDLGLGYTVKRWLANPATKLILNNNGIPFAETRAEVLRQFRTYPNNVLDRPGLVRQLLNSQNMMSDNATVMEFMRMRDNILSQEARTLAAWDNACWTGLGSRRIHADVAKQNLIELCAIGLAPFFPNTVFEVEETLDQMGRPMPPTVHQYAAEPAEAQALLFLLEQKEEKLDSDLTTLGSTGFWDPRAMNDAFYRLWRDLVNGLPATMRLGWDNATRMRIQLMMEVVLGMSPIKDIGITLPLMGPISHRQTEIALGHFQTMEAIYGAMPSDYQWIPFAYRYLVRGTMRNWTIVGTPEIYRIDYDPAIPMRIGNSIVQTMFPRIRTGANAVRLDYVDPLLNRAAAPTFYWSTRNPDTDILIIDEEITAAQIAPAGLAPEAKEGISGQLLVDYIDVVSTTMHDQFFFPRNWRPNNGLGETAVGHITDLLMPPLGAALNTELFIPMYGARMADGGEIKALAPMRTYNMTLHQTEDIKFEGEVALPRTFEVEQVIQGHWTPAPALTTMEVGTQWYPK